MRQHGRTVTAQGARKQLPAMPAAVRHPSRQHGALQQACPMATPGTMQAAPMTRWQGMPVATAAALAPAPSATLRRALRTQPRRWRRSARRPSAGRASTGFSTQGSSATWPAATRAPSGAAAGCAMHCWAVPASPRIGKLESACWLAGCSVAGCFCGFKPASCS